MPLASGSRLGPYEIVSSLGAGGMGEVYRARDGSLGRDVAIKILPDAFAADAERVARFQREARVLASLSHPNIAIVHGLERGETGQALVMELVEGEDLSQRIARGAMPLDEVRAIAEQIGAALEAAHLQGIVHRDLKPANIKIRPDGSVKVLDFGLAKAIEDGSRESGLSAAALAKAEVGSRDPANSPTITTPAMTMRGVILGTAAYMAPEQARGRPVDQRVDIWAFGAVLYEMLSGRQAFTGEDVSMTLANVMKIDPDWAMLPSSLPAAVIATLGACLQKDPRMRLRNAGDVLLALGGAFHTSDGEWATTKAARGSGFRWLLPVAAASALAAVAGTLWLQPRPLPEVVRFQIHAPPGSTLPMGTPAPSPDGRMLAYTVREPDHQIRIHVRAIDSVESRMLPGTEGATHPFWSPDGRSLAFVAQRTLKRVDLAGGLPRSLAPTIAPWQGSWGPQALLYQLSGARGLGRIASEGGDSRPVDLPGTDQSAGFPMFLPDGRRFLSRVTGKDGRTYIVLASLDGAARTLVFDLVSSAAVPAPTPAGATYLLFLRESELVAQRFDEAAGRLLDGPVPIAADIGRAALGGLMPAVGVSPAGTLAYQTGSLSSAPSLVWYDRTGKMLERLPEPLSGDGPSISPDGRQVVIHRYDASGGEDLWLVDLARGSRTRFTFSDGRTAVWSPTGSEILFASVRKGVRSLFVKRADGGGEERPLQDLRGRGPAVRPLSWTPDGKAVLVSATPWDLALLPVTGAADWIPIGSRNGANTDGRISPDGRYIAFASEESGDSEVYVQPMPPRTGQWKVSTNGGTAPRWARNGKELFFVSADSEVMAVDVTLGDKFTQAVPRRLFTLSNISTVGVHYDVSPDGRFLIREFPGAIDSTPITVVRNWWVELRK